MTRDAALADLLKSVEALVKAVRFDEHGEMVAGQFVGGNGGLISRDTMILADTAWRKIDHWHRWWGASLGKGEDEVRLHEMTGLFGDAIRSLDGANLDERTVRLFTEECVKLWRGAVAPVDAADW
jgi:hypothetical protein